MYLHVGEDVMVRSSEIIAILDKDTVNASDEIKQLLDKKAAIVINLVNDTFFKSLVITDSQIYLSPIASVTLKKRLLKPIGHELIL